MPDHPAEDRLDRIERLLERLAERQQRWAERHRAHHDWFMSEQKAVERRQQAAQIEVDQVTADAGKLMARIDEVIALIKDYVKRMPMSGEAS
jgi:uncharacterized protein (DUF3084 family)